MYLCATTAPLGTRTCTYGTSMYSIQNTVTDRRCALILLNTPSVKNKNHRLQDSSSWHALDAEYRTAAKSSKTDRTKLGKHLPCNEEFIMKFSAGLSSRYQALEKLLWKPSEDIAQKSSWNQMSIPIYKVHQTPSTHISPISNVGDRMHSA